ncbi:MAG: class I SAM-dependent methyltransferase [Actinomycetota bacterium]|nr:class I SAM-dependent methyltransferase [Actinomycetota bacterium]
MSNQIRTWHYGLIARWWAEFNEHGDDVEFFRNVIERCGQPALDAGCGTGRLLLPFLRAGLDVDGSDVSPDMLAWCSAKAEAEGLSVDLYTQPMHKLALPRQYFTVVLCGAFGLGGNRALDLEGLRRIHSHLKPNGRLVMDHHFVQQAPGSTYTDPKSLELPHPWPERGDRRRASDGTELELRTRLLEVNAQEGNIVREISVRQFRGDVEVTSETYSIVICIYSMDDVQSMLVQAGFSEVRVSGTLEVHDPALDSDRIIIEATA